MWFGTKYGLNRFDGYVFNWFTVEKHGLQSNEINHILEDHRGRMWLFYTGSYVSKKVLAIDIFDPITEEVQSFSTVFGSDAPFSPNDILSFNQNSDGHLVFFTKHQQIITYTDHFRSIPIVLDDYWRIENIHWSPNNKFWLEFLSSIKDHQTYAQISIFDANGQLTHQSEDTRWNKTKIYEFDQKGNCKFIAANNITQKSQFFHLSNQGGLTIDTTTAAYLSSLNLDFHHLGTQSMLKKQGAYYWIFTQKIVG